jgi:hypothetical protein
MKAGTISSCISNQIILKLSFSQFTFFKVLVHQLFASFSSGFNHVVAPLFSKFDHVSWDVFVSKRSALIGFIPVDHLHLDKVDDTSELIFCTNIQLDWNRVRTKTIFNLVHNA